MRPDAYLVASVPGSLATPQFAVTWTCCRQFAEVILVMTLLELHPTQGQTASWVNWSHHRDAVKKDRAECHGKPAWKRAPPEPKHFFGYLTWTSQDLPF